jgi:hypothetical protein
MGYAEHSWHQPLSRLHLSLPEPDFDVGLTPASLRIKPDCELEAVAVTLVTEDTEYALAISPDAAIGAIVALIEAVDELIPENRP